MSNIFFTSDHHFWHNNIIRYCKRPYNDVEEMNSDFIYKWNSKITKNDIVYHLGDFAFNIPWRIRDLLRILNGSKKILIKGNHDKYSKKSAVEVVGWTEVHGQLQFEEFMLSHRPNYGYKTKLLCGHVHQYWKFNDQGNILNVGVDIWNGYPLELEEIRKIYEQR